MNDMTGATAVRVSEAERLRRWRLVLGKDSQESLDAAGTGAQDALIETFDQLEELLVELGKSSGW